MTIGVTVNDSYLLSFSIEYKKNKYIINIGNDILTLSHHQISAIDEVIKMREKEVEKKLVKAVKSNGGICWKFTSPGTAGVPDRIILMSKGRIAFVEIKALGKKPRPLQLSRHRLLRQLGFRVYVLDNIDDIKKIISEVKNDGVT